MELLGREGLGQVHLRLVPGPIGHHATHGAQPAERGVTVGETDLPRPTQRPRAEDQVGLHVIRNSVVEGEEREAPGIELVPERGHPDVANHRAVEHLRAAPAYGRGGRVQGQLHPLGRIADLPRTEAPLEGLVGEVTRYRHRRGRPLVARAVHDVVPPVGPALGPAGHGIAELYLKVEPLLVAKGESGRGRVDSGPASAGVVRAVAQTHRYPGAVARQQQRRGRVAAVLGRELDADRLAVPAGARGWCDRCHAQRLRLHERGMPARLPPRLALLGRDAAEVQPCLGRRERGLAGLGRLGRLGLGRGRAKRDPLAGLAAPGKPGRAGRGGREDEIVQVPRRARGVAPDGRGQVALVEMAEAQVRQRESRGPRVELPQGLAQIERGQVPLAVGLHVGDRGDSFHALVRRGLAGELEKMGLAVEVEVQVDPHVGLESVLELEGRHV